MWRVLTLNKPEVQPALLNELRKYIIAIQKTKWIGKGIKDTHNVRLRNGGRKQGIWCGLHSR